MGKFSDTLKENNLSGDLSDAVGIAEDIFGVVSEAYAYYGAAKETGRQAGPLEHRGPTLSPIEPDLEAVRRHRGRVQGASRRTL